jgi:hypothetical protein
MVDVFILSPLDLLKRQLGPTVLQRQLMLGGQNLLKRVLQMTELAQPGALLDTTARPFQVPPRRHRFAMLLQHSLLSIMVLHLGL